MSDFAKNLFGFGKQKTQSPDATANMNSSNGAINNQFKSNEHHNTNAVRRVVSNSGFPAEILPHATPTIGLNEKSYAMGTTIKDPTALNRSIT
ncbi:hypothetical protein JL09_g6173, partial [Pichia kudriavzevii]